MKTQITRLCLTACLLMLTAAVGAQDRGNFTVIKDSSGREVVRYGQSCALLIGVSRYQHTKTWKNLESVPSEMAGVAEALKKLGFRVESVSDPDGQGLANAFKTFISKYGLAPDNRLLFFFSGHGYSRLDNTRGYLVPADAPDPDTDLAGFHSTAVAMEDVMAWARKIEARHAIFLFDSCFSGTIFKAKNALSGMPPHISSPEAARKRNFLQKACSPPCSFARWRARAIWTATAT